MKGVKGKLLKKLKSIKPIGSLKQARVLQVSAADGFVETLQKNPSIKALTQFIFKEPEPEKAKESSAVNQEPDVIDVAELMRDLAEEEEEEEGEAEGMDVEDNGIDDKENVRPQRAQVQGKEPIGDKECKMMEGSMRRESSAPKQAPLSEIDISSFRPPDLNSGSLFDPNLLAAFEQAVKEHNRMSEAERQARIEQENLEKIEEEEEEEEEEEAEKQARIELESLENGLEEVENQAILDEVDLERHSEEPPLKARRIEEDDDDDPNPLLGFEEKCPPGGDGSVILYTTTLRGIRKTFEDCNSIRFLLESFRLQFYERDVSMHTEYKEELWRVMEYKALPPRLFVKGRYIGGAEEVLRLHEQGKLRMLFDGIPIDAFGGPCEACSGFRFILCFSCSGSHKVVSHDGSSSQCQNCNENGLIICPHCS